MPEAASSQTTDIYRITYTTTPDEVALYGRLAAQRHTGERESWEGDWLMMYVVAGLAVAAGLICVATGAVNDLYNPTVPLVCGATYYLADPIRDRLVARYHKRARTKRLAEYIGRTYEIELALSGVTQRSDHYTFTIEWPGIEQVTIARNVMFLWTSDRQAVVVPLRAVPEGERSRLMEIGKSRGAALRRPDAEPR